VRAAHGRIGIVAADFSRVGNADLGRFTVDRLMSIVNRLGSRVEVRVRVEENVSGGRKGVRYRFSFTKTARKRYLTPFPLFPFPRN
jgi:hypothetical protein